MEYNAQFFNEFVENVSVQEADTKEQKKEVETMLESITNEIDELTVHKDMACLEMHENEEAKHVYEQSVLYMKKLTVEKKKYNQKLRTLKVTLKEQQQLQGNDSNGIQYLLIEVLEQCNIQKQHFHGGSMNGVCCRRLLDNSGKIFEKIKEITAKRLGTNIYRNLSKWKQHHWLKSSNMG